MIGGAASVLAQSPAITTQDNPRRWTIRTADASYQVILSVDSTLVASHFGADAGPRVYHAPDWDQTDRDRSQTDQIAIREVPYRGGFNELIPALEVVFADGVRELELVYDGYEITERAGAPLLRLDLKDTHYGFEVSEYVRVHPELDLLEKWLVLENTGSDDITVERTYSGSVMLPPGTYDMVHLGGNWGREFIPRRTTLTPGRKSIFARMMKSHQSPPLFMARPEGETDKNEGGVWFGQVLWSGNWQVDAEVNRFERTQITGGTNFWDTHWQLGVGEQFETPKMIVGWADDGTNGASRRVHRYILDHVLPEPGRDEPRPVLYNSWYATTFDVNVEDQLELAEIAADIGVEQFVIDDGWFKGRDDDTAGLGDWSVDRDKFPNGLSPLIEGVHELGMDFGIWVEPEMVNPDSDLFREHTDWALHTPHRAARTSRNQLMLNMAREDVKAFTIEWMDRLLSENDIQFVKWDMNRHMSEAGWPSAPPEKRRELRIRYIQNLYDILDTLRARHPDVLFESCSSGGGRVDAGILKRTDQFWTSDTTDPVDRLFIQHGISYGFPAKAMVNWVTDESWHGADVPLRFYFHVAMAGNLGIGSDLHEWNEEERELAREMIATYKEIRPIVQSGDQYRLDSPFDDPQSAVQFVTRDGQESVVFAYQHFETVRPRSLGTTTLFLQGLDPGTTYRVTRAGGTRTVSGDVLMASGLEVELDGIYASRLIRLDAVSAEE
jgi:alpha-galactosidase